jgi:hypothetical protein
MANSTTTYWDVDGVSLQTYAYNITTLGGSRGALPVFGGENRTTVYRRGAEWRPKVLEPRTLTLAMWVQGSDADGNPPTSRSVKAQYNENLRALRAMFWRDESRLVTLTKRWLSPTDTVLTASAEVEIAGAMEAEMNGPFHSAVMVDLNMPDPFFYGAEQTATLVKDAAQNVVVAGDAKTERVTLVMNGALTNPQVMNTTPNPDVWVRLGVAVAGGTTATIDCDWYTATRSSDGANLIGAVTHSGARHWMPLAAGTNNLTLTASAGTGTCTVKYRPAFW